MDIEKTIDRLRSRGFAVSRFETKEEASAYLAREIQGTTVGIGGCKTADEMGLYDTLKACGNEVFWHWRAPGTETLDRANAAEVYIAGANAIAETGEVLFIDGRGNRLAGLCFGEKTVYILAGINKLCPDFDSALNRARNVAAVKNCERFPVKTPCKLDGKCHDCRTPGRICNALMVLWGPMLGMKKLEIVIINEELGM